MASHVLFHLPAKGLAIDPMAVPDNGARFVANFQLIRQDAIPYLRVLAATCSARA